MLQVCLFKQVTKSEIACICRISQNYCLLDTEKLFENKILLDKKSSSQKHSSIARKCIAVNGGVCFHKASIDKAHLDSTQPH